MQWFFGVGLKVIAWITLKWSDTRWPRLILRLYEAVEETIKALT
jgi:hypothetical protein